MDNYNFNKNSTGSFGKPKASLAPKAQKTTVPKSTGSAPMMDGRWWLWYLKNNPQQSSEGQSRS